MFPCKFKYIHSRTNIDFVKFPSNRKYHLSIELSLHRTRSEKKSKMFCKLFSYYWLCFKFLSNNNSKKEWTPVMLFDFGLNNQFMVKRGSRCNSKGILTLFLGEMVWKPTNQKVWIFEFKIYWNAFKRNWCCDNTRNSFYGLNCKTCVQRRFESPANEYVSKNKLFTLNRVESFHQLELGGEGLYAFNILLESNFACVNIFFYRCRNQTHIVVRLKLISSKQLWNGKLYWCT